MFTWRNSVSLQASKNQSEQTGDCRICDEIDVGVEELNRCVVQFIELALSSLQILIYNSKENALASTKADLLKSLDKYCAFLICLFVCLIVHVCLYCAFYKFEFSLLYVVFDLLLVNYLQLK